MANPRGLAERLRAGLGFRKKLGLGNGLQLAAIILLAACSQVQTEPDSQTSQPATGTAESATDSGAPASSQDQDKGTDQADQGDSDARAEQETLDAPLGADAEAPETIDLKEPDAHAGRQTVALLLPLSGSKGPLGESMLRAAELAMFDIATDNFDLIVRDTQGTPEGAQAAARSAVDAGANLILGPVFSQAVKAVNPIAQGGQVPVLAFSNNPQVAETGTYVMGLMPEQQVRRVVSYAVRQGRRTFAVLAPENAYGTLIVEALRASVKRYGGNLHHVAYYPPGSQDVSDQVKRLAGTGFGEMENAAVMLPAGGKQLQTLAPTLPFFDIDSDKVKFLGTTLWNDPSLGTEPSLVGGWFAAPPPSQRDTFQRRFRAAFASDPHDLASLAYDATALAALLARRAERAGDPPPAAYTAERLTQSNGFAGVDGVFRLRDNGQVQRLYAVLEMQRNNLEIIDRAPSRFEPRIN